MWELDCEEGWEPKNWCLWTVVLEKTLESLLDCKEIQPVHSAGDQPWDFFGRNDAKAETPVLWPPHAKSWLIGKDSDAGRDWGQEEKGTPEDEMAGWHHWLDGCDSGWTPGVGDGQEGLGCCNSWGRKESDTTERLIWSDLNCSMSGFPVPHDLLEFAQIHGHWVSDAIDHLTPFTFRLQSFPASTPFSVSRLFASGGWSIGASALVSVPPMNIQGWFPLGLIGLNSFQSKGL